MKILHQRGRNEIAITKAPTPEPGPGEVLIKTAVSALCGSEMHTVRGEGLPEGNLGHEAAGVVVAMGEGADQHVNVGDRVGASAIVGCGHCAQCSAGRYTWCDTYTFHPNMHAEYFTLPAHGCQVLPPEVSWDVGVLISGDGFGVPYHTSTKLPPAAKLSSTVAIFGLGPIGLGNVIMQTHLGRRVIGVDRAPARLELARKFGAADVIQVTPESDPVAQIKALTDGVDIAIEAAGVPPTAKLCFAAVRKGGTVIFNGEQPALPLSPSDDFIRRDITAIGSWFYHFGEFADMLELVRRGVPIDTLVTHKFPFAEVRQAYQAMQGGLSGKVLLTYDQV